MEPKVALVTGANSGIGLALCERLLNQDPNLFLCLACRNKMKAEAARDALKLMHPDTTVDIILVDVSCLVSVYKAAKEIKKKYHRLDYMFMNAGIFPVTSLNWSYLIQGVFEGPRTIAHMFGTGHGLLKQEDGLTDEGFQQIFATNVLGHFVLIRELQDILGGDQSQIMWTSSSNAKKDSFSIDDIESVQGIEPYSSSKYCTDLLSIALNKQLNSKNIYSHTVCPGLVLTQITYAILPWWLWYVLMPLFWSLRLLTANLTMNAYSGCEALVWLTKQDASTLDPNSKFHSQSSVLGRPYVKREKLNIEDDLAEQVANKLSKMVDNYILSRKEIDD